jgi:putative ABC transport system permease protein
MSLFRRISILFSRSSVNREIDAELRSHIEMRVEDNLAIGMPPAEARRDAMLRFGNLTKTREQVSAVNAVLVVESISMDAHYAFRQLARSPGFAAATILTISLGVGASTAIFGVVNSVLVRPLSYPHAERIVQTEKVTTTGLSYSASIPLFLYWRDHSRTLQHLSAYSVLPVGFNLAERSMPERIPGLRVSADFFRVLGVAPQLGRNFAKEDDEPGSQRVAILGESLWHRRYNNDREIVGKSIRIDGEPYTVIGVLPRGFQFLATTPTLSAVEIWIPLQLPATSRDPRSVLECIGRLNAGVTREEAASEITSLSRQLAAELPTAFPSAGTVILPALQQRITEDARPILMLLFGAVGFVLLIVCANVANLLLARMGDRAGEIGVRNALGASTLRIIRQLLTENLVLALSGGLLGMLVAWLANKSLITVAPVTISRFGATSLDWRVLSFAIGVSLSTGVLFGLLPAVRSSGMGAGDALHSSSSRTSTSARSHRRVSGSLIVAETALSLILLFAAGLLIASFLKLQHLNPGFNYSQIATFETTLSLDRYGSPASLERFLQNALQRIQKLPGVESVASVSSLPTEPTLDFPFTIAGGAIPPPGQSSGDSAYLIVSSGYFQTMEIPVLKGRQIEQSDSEHSPGVVVINQTMARQYFPNENPIGKRIVIAQNLGPDFADEPREIIGVVGDAKADELNTSAPPSMYTPFAQLSPHLASLLVGTIPIRWAVRTRPDSGSPDKELANAMLQVDPEQPIAEARMMRELLSDALERWRFNMLLLIAFASIALFLAAVGIYGVISYTVAQRTHEIGVRMALGANRTSILQMVLKEAGLLLAGGTIFGLCGVALMSRIMNGFLYGVTVGNPVILGGVVSLICSVGLIAAWRPACRAASIDPARALRSE